MRPLLAVVVIASFIDVAAARAQSVAERLVSKQSTLVIETIDGPSIGKLAGAAHLPIGLVWTTPLPEKLSIRTAGRRLGDILDEMVSADPRYQWQDLDGVVVIRASHVWSDFLLPRPGAGLSLINGDASDAGTLIAQMTGHEHQSGQISDSRTVSAVVPSGATLFDALNEIVRAHGSLAWAMGPADGSKNPIFVANMMLFSGTSGWGFGVRDNAVMNPQPVRVERPERRGAGRSSIDWDQVVPNGLGGRPIEASLISDGSIRDLAMALRIPMGIETLPPPIRPGDGDLLTSAMLSGKTLGEAVAILSSLDPRYQWRDMGGVIVFRPVTTWADPQHPLSRRINGFRLDDALLTDVMAAFSGLLGTKAGSLPDTHRFSIDSPPGTILDAVNAIVRSHGRLYWEFGPIPLEQRQFYRGIPNRLSVHLFAPGGIGILVP